MTVNLITGAGIANTKLVGGGDIGIGDSTLQGPGFVAGRLNRTSWFDYLAIASGGVIRWRQNAGASGSTTAQVLARLPGVLALNPSRVFFLCGINDVVFFPAPETTTRANYKAMADQCLAAGVEPIFLTPLPSTTSFRTAYERLQNWLLQFCDANRIMCIDTHAAVTNPTTTLVGDWQTGLSVDGTHPTNAGAAVIGAAVLSRLNQLPTRRNSPYLSTVNSDSLNLLTNSLFTTDTNSDGVPDGWVSGGNVGDTFTLPTDPLGHGKLMTITRNSTGGSATNVVSTTLVQGGQPNAGDRIALTFRLITTINAAGAVARFTVNNTAGGSFFPVFDWTDDLNTTAYVEFTAGASPSSFAVQLSTASTTGQIQIGQLTAVNLSANGGW